MTKLTYDWINDEEAEVFVDGHLIGTMGHGPHGWDGMVGIQQMLTSLAHLLGWDIEEKGDPAI